jgi:hypothetical protein
MMAGRSDECEARVWAFILNSSTWVVSLERVGLMKRPALCNTQRTVDVDFGQALLWGIGCRPDRI